MTGYVERSALTTAARSQRTFRLAADRVSVRYRAHTLLVCGALVVATAGIGVLAIGTGDYPVAPTEVVRTLFGYGDSSTEFIVLTLRLPRALVAVLVGAALGLSGAVFQSVSRNPLGSPDIIGFTTGAATGAVLGIIVFSTSSMSVAGFALVGGLATAVAVYFLAWRHGVQGYRLILVGIGISAMLMSVNSYLLTRAELNDAMTAQVWLTGSLNGRGWDHAGPIAAALVVLVPLVLIFGQRLSLLEMGDDTAKALGVPVERTRLVLVLAAVGLCAVATAAAGPIGFIALAAPQIARRLIKAPGVGLVSAGLMGSMLLLISDFAAQRLLAPTQLPVGVMTGAVGGIYLAWLLAKGWRAGRG